MSNKLVIFVGTVLGYMAACAFNMLVMWAAIGLLIENFGIESWSNEIKVMWLSVSYLVTELGILQHKVNKK